MATLPSSHAALRKVCEYTLFHLGTINKFFGLNIVADMSNRSAGFSLEKKLTVTTEEVKAAYRGADHLQVIRTDENTGRVLVYYRARPEANKDWVYAIGWFESADHANNKRPCDYPLGRGHHMGDEMRAELEVFLNERMKAAAAAAEKEKKRKREADARNAKKAKKEEEKLRKKEAARIKREESKKRLEQDEEKERLEEREASLRAEAARIDIKVKRLYEDRGKIDEERGRIDSQISDARIEYEKLDVELGELSTMPEPIVVREGCKTFMYILGCRIGKFQYSGGSILPADLEENLISLPEGYAEAKHDETRDAKESNYEEANLGVCQFFGPPGMATSAKNHQGKKEDSHVTMSNMEALFSGEQSTFGKDALRLAAAFNCQGYGASDQGTEMIQAGTIAALVKELHIDISAEGIGKGLWSGTTNVRAEERLAAECLLVVLDEIREDGATNFALMSDHGKRNGLEHFVKILVWCGWKDDAKTEKTIKFHCVDVDSSFHDAQGCADAIKKSLEVFTESTDIKITCLTGDAGGGASVQNLLPALLGINAIDAKAVKVNCLMHALNKALECAGQDTFGEQGIGKRTPYQLLFVFNQLWKAIKEEGGGKKEGKKFLDEIYAHATDKLINDSEAQREADANFPQAYRNFLDILEDLEDMEGDEDGDLDDLVAFITETPSGNLDPVFSRWKSVMATADVVINYWPQIYFIAVSLVMSQKNNYLYTLSATLLSLMNERPPKKVSKDNNEREDDEEEEEEFSFDPDKLQSTQCRSPTFYVMILFFSAFGKAYFNDMFDWTMRDDPLLGSGSYGQTSRLCVERCYIMHKFLAELEDGGWEQRAEFNAYKAALEEIEEEEDGDDTTVGRKYFDNASVVFLQRFRFVFDKHVHACWTDDSILHYLLGGEPALANEFARWLVDYVAMQDEDPDDDDIEHDFSFESDTIDMKHHYRFITDKKVSIRVDECMEYLTADADRSAIMESPFIKRHWQSIEKMGMCPHVVDLFDRATWGDGNDFTTLRDAIWDEIAIHPSHQQRCEQYVQLAALVAKTNVAEVRRTIRAIILSTIIRPFHQWAKEIIEEENGNAPRQIKGSIRIKYLIKYMEKFTKKLQAARRRCRARGEDPDQMMRMLLNKLTCKDEKTSAVGRKRKLAEIVGGLNKKRKISKAEKATGVVDQTMYMQDGVLFKYLTLSRSCDLCQSNWKKRQYDPQQPCQEEGCCMAGVHAELKKLKIKLSNKQYRTLTIVEKRHLIRKHVGMRLNTGDRAKEGFDIKTVRFFRPKSRLMKSLRQMCRDELSRENGISALISD